MNCKPGDLAIVVQSESPALGAIVNVVRFLGYRERADGRDGRNSWECTSVGGKHDAVSPDGKPCKARRFYVPDAWLRPIRGEEEPESIVRELETT